MKKEIIFTSDHSHSIAVPAMNVTYHSTHGAIQESMHVFIEAGYNHIAGNKNGISIFEMGFGTGLNALLTIAAAEKKQQKVYYETVETEPLEASMYSRLNYCKQLNRPDLQPLFELLHGADWNGPVELTPYFSFKKNLITLTEFSGDCLFDLIYFDAFAPEVQPDLWTTGVFKKLYGLMEPGAVLTTYCSKSIVRKAMAEAGLAVEKIPGPPHKREMVRAAKIN
jgi:tRNA U34 5-methylaminomethyl-2-thiouridine-forming methyltransferase MnmC